MIPIIPILAGLGQGQCVEVQVKVFVFRVDDVVCRIGPRVRSPAV